MKKKSVEEIMQDFYEEYQKNPEGWNFWVSSPPSSDEFHEVYITRGAEAFFLKMDSIFSPNPVGMGTKLRIKENQLVEDLPEFGYRKFSETETKKFLKNLPKPEEYESKEKFKEDIRETREEIVKKAMGKNPIPFDEEGKSPGLAAVGPYSSSNPLDYVSEEQKKVRKKLSKELEKLINRDYPGHY